MSFDISELLSQWDYQPGKLSVRKFHAKDGTEKIQLRIDLGLLQMNAEGRPDGKKPFGHGTLLEHLQAQHKKLGDKFKLSAEDCAKLHQEAIQFHHRYICLFQIDDFTGVLFDTERNLEAMHFVNEHAPSEDHASPFKLFLPQLMMMHTRARASLDLRDKLFEQAIDIIETGIEALRNFFKDNSRHELLESSSELQSLEKWLAEIKSTRPLSPREKLENALNEAVAREDFEKAAEVRDALKALKQATTD